LIIVIDIQQFTPLAEFYNRVTKLVEYVKSSPTSPPAPLQKLLERGVRGEDEILVPGEPEYREREERLKSGIFVDETTWHQIKEISQELGIST
jgi:LDH2 family malate/lactate/ureidoglycolate dehydrogenase